MIPKYIEETPAAKPASALPWRVAPPARGRQFILCGQQAIAAASRYNDLYDDKERAYDNAAYIAHACNAYPALVAKAFRCINALSANGAPNCEGAKEMRALLRSLGEL